MKAPYNPAVLLSWWLVLAELGEAGTVKGTVGIRLLCAGSGLCWT